MPIDPNNLGATAKLTFADEFNTLSLWDGKAGTWSSNWWYNDEWGLYSQNRTATDLKTVDDQWYVNYNFAGTKAVQPWTVTNGVLTIEATYTPPELASLMANKPYTSGLLNSWHSFSQQYGYFEISAKVPTGKGLWPAFWLLQQDGDWPPEIDIFEVLGHDTDTLVQTVHTEASGSHTFTPFTTRTVDLSLDFHRYGVDWQKDYITFYLDGQATAKIATPADLHEPMYIIANMTVGGPWSGNPDASTVFPAHLEIDYIRVYTDPTAPAPVLGGGSGVKSGQGVTLKGGDAGDAITGENGDDRLFGYVGDDTLHGGDGADFIEAADGHDRINGNMGADSIYSGAGDDWALGGKDNDLVYGGIGDDIVHGNMGSDTIAGMAGNDIMRGGQGDDSVYSADGNDWLAGDRGDDTISGGAGADIFHSFDGAGLDRITDFSLAQGDKILLAAGTSYSVAQVGGDTVIQVGAEAQVVLVGVSSASLTGDWLLFG